jgi:hypothetical protein
MSSVTRQHARLTNELGSVHRRLRNITETISRLELDSRALAHAKEQAMAKEVIVSLTRADVFKCAREMGIPEEAITADILHAVRKGLDYWLEHCRPQVVKEAINFALKS